MGDGADYVFEAVGSGRLLRQAWDLAAPAGTVVGIGVAAKDDTVVLPAQELALTEKTLMGSVYGTSRPQQDMLRYLDLYRSGELKLDELITREYPLAEINEAFRDLGEGRISGRAVFSLR
jgi:Zn-dependent alcohol dehydrogenase